MTVDQLIKKLSTMDKDKIVLIGDSDGVGWDNIGKVIEKSSTAIIVHDEHVLFEN